MKLHRPLALLGPWLLLAGLCVGLTAVPALAADQDSAEPQAKSEKQKAREARIEEYLRKREERRAKRDLERAQRQGAADAAATGQAAETAEPAEAQAPRERRRTKRSNLPRHLERAQDAVRGSAMGQDPSVQRYLDLIDQEEASPHQLAAFGNFLAQSGMTRVALDYYQVALSIEKRDPLLWLNLGTLHRQLGELGPAMGAFGRTLSLDPNNALAHYNVGTIFDEQGKYEEAIEAYTVALTLDPSLGDPQSNPQATNNDRLLAVKLRLYQQQAGTLGLPLVEVPRGELPPEAPRPPTDAGDPERSQ